VAMCRLCCMCQVQKPVGQRRWATSARDGERGRGERAGSWCGSASTRRRSGAAAECISWRMDRRDTAAGLRGPQPGDSLLDAEAAARGLLKPVWGGRRRCCWRTWTRRLEETRATPRRRSAADRAAAAGGSGRAVLMKAGITSAGGERRVIGFLNLLGEVTEGTRRTRCDDSWRSARGGDGGGELEDLRQDGRSATAWRRWAEAGGWGIETRANLWADASSRAGTAPESWTKAASPGRGRASPGECIV